MHAPSDRPHPLRRTRRQPRPSRVDVVRMYAADPEACAKAVVLLLDAALLGCGSKGEGQQKGGQHVGGAA
jgi:hypothetical protein